MTDQDQDQDHDLDPDLNPDQDQDLLCSPMASKACCSSRVKAVRGTSSETGSTVTVDRLEAWFPASHLLPEVCRARLRAGGHRKGHATVQNTQLLHTDVRSFTCQRPVDLLEDLLAQQVDQPGHHLTHTHTHKHIKY